MYLNCHTYYSLKYGTISPKELLDEAQQNDIDVLALTDINNTSAMLDIIRQSEKYKIRIIAGIDFRNDVHQQFVCLAKNNNGFYELNKFLSEQNHEKVKIPAKAPLFQNAVVIYPFEKKQPNELQENEYVGIRISNLNKLPFSVWHQHQNKLVMMQPVTFRNKREFNAHRILRAIDNNKLLSQLSKTEEACIDEIMLSKMELINKFAHYPKIIENTVKILSECSIYFDFSGEYGHNNQQSYTSSEELDFKLIKHLCYKGIPYRYSKVNDVVLDRINTELQVIRQKGFVSYFLIAWKILKYARKSNYFYVGRGSGANSIASYLLQITDVDPIELNLYFERFINLFRKSPPDFDIDFSWKDREDVTRYIFKKFPNATLLGAYSTFKYKSVIREIAKVFGLPEHEIKQLQHNPHTTDELKKLVLKYGKLIQGFPSHITVHSAGIIIPEKSIYHFTSTFMPQKGFPTTHFDMHTAEDIGLHKFDILGQRGLAKIKETLEIIKQTKDEEVDIHNMNLLKNDVASNNLLKKGAAIGCFYVESPAMRMLLMKLQVTDYLGLVAASSVIRPGVAQSGMMQEYILRHRNLARRKWAELTHPILYELMPETYGVMVYQEDVIKVAHYFAGLSLAEADVLRRGMSGKYRSREEFQAVKDHFFSNCSKKGISTEVVNDVWNQIESFAGYAFAKGHSASYAVESYQCLYLKAYYPLEFLVATINNGGGFYSKELYFHEARKHGATVHLPCINNSDAATKLTGSDIYIGLNMLDSLESEYVSKILNERIQNGEYKSFNDFVKRTGVTLDQLRILIRSDVFRFTGKQKKELLWEAHLLLGKVKQPKPVASLFEIETKKFKLPKLWNHPLEHIFDEIELIGFVVSSSPFLLAKELPSSDITAKLFPFYVEKCVTMVGYLIHIKYVKTKKGKLMYFGTFTDVQGDWIDAVIFPPIAEKYPFSGPGCYLLHGKISQEFDFYSLEIIWQKRIPSQNMDEDISTRLKPVQAPTNIKKYKK